MSDVSLDATDRALVNLLRGDARLTNKAIATKLGVAEGTIRARLKRLQEAQLVRFTALTNIALTGPLRVLLVRAKTSPTELRAVAEAISAMPEFKAVTITTDTYGVVAIALTGDHGRDADSLTALVAALPGVHATHTSLITDSLKYAAGLARINNNRPLPDDEE